MCVPVGYKLESLHFPLFFYNLTALLLVVEIQMLLFVLLQLSTQLIHGKFLNLFTA